ncbi:MULTISPECIES: GntR family transcriptional regulator [Pontibacillus]|uniref:GntR family transcriptional regulator n=1 Tax=Pontibacillus chungwhensis TaxID=265426 RepID=A0ABY8UUF2_9BACI|nr:MULTISPECIES: GntR family transcriptional regulator [Pontibacillus]MCD5325039.1 GntR family transcriptional regulator [Pontibacillus sp. HN14]WIF97296.1 GntR family transcriptional regulator [Pontibacillus chungwhensis]
MPIDFQQDRPIYQQLMDRLSNEIVRGDRMPGDKLPSVREYAVDTGVNPNTVSRVYRELEQLTIVESRRGQGTFVTEDQKRLNQLREELKERQIDRFITEMKQLGFSENEMIQGLQAKAKGEGN